MKKLFLLLNMLIFSASVWGYEFAVSAVTTPVGKTIPKQVLVHKKAAAVVFLKTDIAHLQDIGSNGAIEQDKTSTGYVLYVAPDWPTALWLTAPGFMPKQVEIGKLPPNSMREITVSATGKDPKGFRLPSASLSFEADPTNATAAVTPPYSPEIWLNTDASFSQVQGLLKEGEYAAINATMPPYRVRPKKKKAKAGDVLSPDALSKLGANVQKMPLEERVVYNLDIRW